MKTGKNVTFLIAPDEIEGSELRPYVISGLNQALDIACQATQICIESGPPVIQTASYKRNWIKGAKYVKNLLPKIRLQAHEEDDKISERQKVLDQQKGLIYVIRGIESIIEKNPISDHLPISEHTAMTDGANAAVKKINEALQAQRQKYSEQMAKLTQLPNDSFKEPPGTILHSVARSAVRHPVAAAATVLTLITAAIASTLFIGKSNQKS